jgi:hypothetical protein
VHDVSIQTAGGGQVPEVVIIAPKNPKELRDRIIAHRDAIVAGQNGRGDDGTGVSSSAPLLASSAGDIKQQEMVEINRTLLRIEKMMAEGLTKI